MSDPFAIYEVAITPRLGSRAWFARTLQEFNRRQGIMAVVEYQDQRWWRRWTTHYVIRVRYSQLERLLKLADEHGHRLNVDMMP